MTFTEIHSWCCANGADVRGIQRGKEFIIRGQAPNLPADMGSLSEVFHWDLEFAGKHYPVSPSDMERLLSGVLTVDFYTGSH